jgi:hypothetical protein
MDNYRIVRFLGFSFLIGLGEYRISKEATMTAMWVARKPSSSIFFCVCDPVVREQKCHAYCVCVVPCAHLVGQSIHRVTLSPCHKTKLLILLRD